MKMYIQVALYGLKGNILWIYMQQHIHIYEIAIIEKEAVNLKNKEDW